MSNGITGALSRCFETGTMLFEENDPGSRMYVIRSGRVRIFKRVGDTEIVLAFLGPGDFFGEMALLEQLPRSANAEVIERCELIEVDQSTFEHLVQHNHGVTARIMRKLAARVRDLDERIEKLLVDSMLGRAVEVLRWLLPAESAEGASAPFTRIVRGATKINIATQAGIPPPHDKSVMQQLEASRLIQIEGDDLLVARRETLDQYSAFLNLKRRYETPLSQNDPQQDPGERDEVRKAVNRLMAVLSIDPEDLERKQAALAEQYRRYAELKQRFGGGGDGAE